jgi:hypothetical protein
VILAQGKAEHHRAFKELTAAHARFLAIRGAWNSVHNPNTGDTHGYFTTYRQPERAQDVGDIRTLEGFVRMVASDARICEGRSQRTTGG